MKEKNRFSSLLKRLMAVAGLKNHTLATQLQYDESYISKWVNGNSLPSEKTADSVLRGISRCIVDTLDNDSRQALYLEYQVDQDDDLMWAAYDNLQSELNYVRELKETTGSNIAPQTLHYPELTLAEFWAKMQHPSLRQVKSLFVVAMIDILSLDQHYQLMMADFKGRQDINFRYYPGVHFSMLINLNLNVWTNPYNAVFLINMLSKETSVDFQLYNGMQAVGKIVFAVKDAYAISGMVVDKTHCLSVVTSEDITTCNAIYDRVMTFCNNETLLVRKVTMDEMLHSHDYLQYLFARNQRWLLGHLTEHFLPDDLHEELAADYRPVNEAIDKETLQKTHILVKSILENMDIQILIHEDALTDFAVSGQLDFYNQKVILTPQQRLKYLQHVTALFEKNPRLNIKMLRSGLLTDLQCVPNPTLFLSDTLCYLRLVRTAPTNNISILNKVQICDVFRSFFDDIWTDDKYVAIEGRISAAEMAHHVIQTVNILLKNG